MSVEQVKISLVVPVYNEEDTLPSLFAALEAAAPSISGQLEYVFIDDGSQDRTLAMLKEFQSRLIRAGLSVIFLKEKLLDQLSRRFLTIRTGRLSQYPIPGIPLRRQESFIRT